MKFDVQGEGDESIPTLSRCLRYPEDVTDVPQGSGTYVFLDKYDEVLYVSAAADLWEEITADVVGVQVGEELYQWVPKSAHATGAEKCCCFLTDSRKSAEVLEAKWMEKYQPRNNEWPKHKTG